MLAILIVWVICGFIFLVFGKLLVNLSFIFNKKNYEYGTCDLFFLGICSVGTVLSILSIWIPINNIIAWVLLSISVVYSFYLYIVCKDRFLSDIFNKVYNLPLSTKTLLLFTFVVILIYCLLPPSLTDMRLYYMQTMLWNETYPIIPGLGNIHGRFGFNSNILLLSSAFTFKDIFPSRIYGILGLATFVFICWGILKMKQSKSFSQQIALVFLCFTFILLYSSFISAPGTDVLPNILVAYVLLRAIFQKDSIQKTSLIFWILPIYAITLKLSVIPLCLFCLFTAVQLLKTKQYTYIVFLIVAGLMIIIPWCARNIILTGYLIYPYPSIDLFDVDWKIPEYMADIEKRWVSSWAKMPGIGYEDFEKMSFSEWSKIWLFRHIKFLKINLFTYCLAAISPFIILWIWKTKKAVSKTQIFIWFVAFCGFVFWLILAPDARFGYGFIITAALIPFLLINLKLKNKKWLQIPSIILVMLFVYLMSNGVLSNVKIRGDKSYLSYLYLPQTVDILNKKDKTLFKTEQVGFMKLYVPNNMLCSDHELPCAPYFNNNLEMRGNSIKDGFRIKKQ